VRNLLAIRWLIEQRTEAGSGLRGVERPEGLLQLGHGLLTHETPHH
jgi:hypothetical protein